MREIKKADKDKHSIKRKKAKYRIRILVLPIICILLAIGIYFGISKWQDIKNENDRIQAIEKLNKNLYSDMTSKEMYNATRELTASEKRGLVDMFIMKFKEDKRNNIESIAENETHARYLFCL